MRKLMVFFCWSMVAVAKPGPEAQQTVVLYNAVDPESVSLAKYYAKRREIPDGQLIGVTTSAAEEISRAEYQSSIAVPLRAALISKGLWQEKSSTGQIVNSQARFLAIIKGIPLKILPDPTLPPNRSFPDAIGQRNEASVDSEIAVLAAVGANPAGVLGNPYFRRFTPVIELNAEPGLIMVGRLDGPDAVTVRGMIDDAISSETDGLWGWGYVDSRGIPSGAYAEGDQWLRGAQAAMRKQGIPVLMDASEPTLPAGFPVTDAAVYYGWYAPDACGPFADPLTRFRPGAVAVHLHSFSAATLRSATSGWCGPLLARGAAATLGNVFEPYLSFTADLEVFQDRLMAGFTFAESASMAMRVVSWMGVAVGDPLYKPYAVWQKSIPLANMSSWERYRRIVRGNDGDVSASAKALQAAAQQTGNTLFLEALGAAQLDAGDTDAALKSIRTAIGMEKQRDIRFRLGLEEYAILRATGDKRAAGRVLSRMSADDISARARALLASFHEDMTPSVAPPPG